jgi:hypothetical protein
MPDTELVRAPLAPTGDRLLTPPLRGPAHASYRVVLEGVYTFGYNGEPFDALYRTGPEGPFTRRHAFIQWTPREPALVSADQERHRYVYQIPPEWGASGQSVGVRVDIDRFVDEFLISPSEVRGALAGSMQFTTVEHPLVEPFPWALLVGAGMPTALVLAGAAVVIRRRMALAGLAGDLQDATVRIERKYRQAQAAVRRQPGGFMAVGGRLDEVRQGAAALIQQIQGLRRAQRLTDRRAVEAELAALQRRLEGVSDPGALREGEAALAERRKALALLDDAARAESRCAMRLAKIEAVLDTAVLSLRSVSLAAPAAPAEEALRGELDAEVAAIREVAREASGFEAQLETQPLSSSLGPPQ